MWPCSPTFLRRLQSWSADDRVSLASGYLLHADKLYSYYESWSATRKCQSVRHFMLGLIVPTLLIESKVTPEELNLSGYTHVNFAFAFFDPSNFQITPMDSNSGSLISRFTALKEKYPGLETWISVGGWSFTDPGPTQKAFSTMTSTAANRRTFVDGLIKFMNQYGFDGTLCFEVVK